MTQPVPQFADPGEAHAYAEYVRAQQEEYGAWTAAREIRVGGALAFAAGHPVPASTVTRMGWDATGEVVRAGTPVPAPGVDRAEQLRARQAELDRERAAIAAELGEQEPERPALPAAEDREDEGE